MIVQCTSCQTRFRVPDEKVGERAVKVRCSKCAAVFAIRRGSGDVAVVVGKAPAPAAAPVSPPISPADVLSPPVTDPFASLKLPPGQPPPDVDVTTPGLYVAGINATRSPATVNRGNRPGAPGPVPGQRTDTAAMSAAAAPSPLPEFTPPAPVPLDPFASLSAFPPVPPPTTESDPFARLDLNAPSAPFPAVAGPGITESDPFASLDVAPPSTGTPAPAAVPPPRPPDSDPFANLDLSNLVSRDALMDRPAPAGPSPERWVPPPSPAQSDPFADLDVAQPSGPPAAASGTVSPPMGTGAVASPPRELPEEISFSFTQKPSPPITTLAKEPDPFAEFAARPDPFAAAEGGPSSEPPAADPPTSNVDTRAGAVDDFFASSPQASEAPVARSALDSSDGPQDLGAPDRSLFALPDPQPSSAASPQSFAPRPPEGDLELVGERAAKIKSRAGAASANPSKKVIFANRSLGEILISSGLNLILIIGVAWAALLTYASWRAGGRFDTALLRPNHLVSALAGASDPTRGLSFDEVTNGLYETEGGRPVFYLMGRVSNHGRGAIGPLTVKLEILDGDRVLGKAEAPIRALANPEQIHAVTSARNLDALLKGLQEGQPSGSTMLEPRASAPFLILSLDYPEDIATRTLRLSSMVGTPVAGRP